MSSCFIICPRICLMFVLVLGILRKHIFDDFSVSWDNLELIFHCCDDYLLKSLCGWAIGFSFQHIVFIFAMHTYCLIICPNEFLFHNCLLLDALILLMCIVFEIVHCFWDNALEVCHLSAIVLRSRVSFKYYFCMWIVVDCYQSMPHVHTSHCSLCVS